MFIKALHFLAILSIALSFSYGIQAQKKKPAKAVKKARPSVPFKIISDGAGSSAGPRKNETPEQKRRIETFDKVWQTVKDNFYDPNFNGVDWEKVREEYSPKLPALKSDSELHSLLQEMINRLNVSHFYVIPPDAYKEIEKARAESAQRESEKKRRREERAESGSTLPENYEDSEIVKYEQFGLLMDAKILGAEFVVTRVEQFSSASKAGLKPGYTIEKINGVSVRDLIIRLEGLGAYSKLMKSELTQVLVSFFDGDPGSEIELTFLNEKNEETTALIQREGKSGQLASILSNLPDQLVTFENRSIDEKIGYIRFNFFALPILTRFCGAITEFKNKESIIIDMRGNSGGAMAVLYAVSGLLSEKPIVLGSEAARRGKFIHRVNPFPKNYKGKLAILIDAQSLSAAEIFASGLKENGRAIVIGDKSAGQALPSLSILLPTGAGFVYPVADFKSKSGRSIEGNGVEPDIKMPLSRKTLLEGRDEQLETALGYLRGGIAKNFQLKDYPFSDFDKPPPPTPRPTPKPAGNPNDPPPKLAPPPRPAPPIGTVRLGDPPAAPKQNRDITFGDPPPPKAAPPKPDELSDGGRPPAPRPTPAPTPKPALPKPLEMKQDEKALQIVKEFIAAIGGEAAIAEISSYIASGSIEMDRAGSPIVGKYEIFRKAPNKLAEITTLDGAGEIREAFDGKNYFTQSIFQGITDISEKRALAEYALFAEFHEMPRFKELYPQIKYSGIFERLGKKIHLIEATSKDGAKIAFTFDPETKLLLSRAGTFTDISYSDYKKFNEILFPASQTYGRSLKLNIKELKLNPQIDDRKFIKEENCFTKID